MSQILDKCKTVLYADNKVIYTEGDSNDDGYDNMIENLNLKITSNIYVER